MKATAAPFPGKFRPVNEKNRSYLAFSGKERGEMCVGKRQRV